MEIHCKISKLSMSAQRTDVCAPLLLRVRLGDSNRSPPARTRPSSITPCAYVTSSSSHSLQDEGLGNYWDHTNLCLDS